MSLVKKEVENANNRDGRPSGPAEKKRKVDDNLYDIIYFSDEDDAIGSRIPSGNKNKKATKEEGLKGKLGDNLEEDNDDIESTFVLEADDKEEEDHSDCDETTTHHAGQVFKCRNCDFSAFRKNDLKKHWETIHVGDDSHQKFATENSRDDLETVAGKKVLSTRQYFKCTHCGRSYKSLPSLNRHITVCKRISVIELFVPNLEHDMKDKDKEGVVEFFDVSAPDVEVVVGVGEGEGEVVVGVGEGGEEEVVVGVDEVDEDCMKDESISSTRRKHNSSSPKSEKSESTFKCQLCKKNLTRLQITEGHECSKFLCKTCGKQFAHKSHLRRHEISHSREKPYKCGLCDKAYFRADMLVDHRRTHPGYKPYQCAICKTCFTIKKLLHEHLKVVHSKVRNLGEYCVYTNSMSPDDTGNSNCSNPRKNVENEEEERIEEGEQIEGEEKIEKEGEIVGDGEHKELERIEEEEKVEQQEEEIIGKEFEIGDGKHEELERIEEEEKVEQGEEEIIGKEAAIIIGVGEYKGQDEGEEHREANDDDDGDMDFNVEDNTNDDEDYGCYDEEENDEVDKVMKQLFDKGFGKQKNNYDVDKGSGKQENDDDKISDKLEGTDSVEHEAEQLTDEEIEIDSLIESLSKNVNVEIYIDNYKGQCKRKKLHKCTACSYITDSRQSLVIHERKHTGERPYQCKICLKSYVSASILAQHERKHTGEKPFVCEICGRAFAEKGAMKRHIKSLHNMERPFRCDFNCGKVFSSKRNMERHVRGSHTGERPFACPLCPKRFFDRSNYHRHIKRHEPKPVVEDSDEGEAVVDSVVVKNVLTRRGARKVKPKKAIVISNDETVAVERHTTQKYLCRVCTFSDSSMGVVEEHQKMHRVFKCRSCALRFTDKEHLLEHKRREHVEEKPYMCGVCGKAFKRRDVMQKHEKLHSSTDRFECSYCGKQFATRPSLITHEKKHSGVRPYLCSQCSCMFTEKGSLLRHERVVHSSERPFMCSQCPKTFALKNNLVRHERSHLPVRMVKCEECDAHFKEKTNLLKHCKRVHGYVTPKSVFEDVNTS